MRVSVRFTGNIWNSSGIGDRINHTVYVCSVQNAAIKGERIMRSLICLGYRVFWNLDERYAVVRSLKVANGKMIGVKGSLVILARGRHNDNAIETTPNGIVKMSR